MELEYIIWLAVGYILLVLLVESLVWRFQPPMDGALTLIVQPAKGARIERRLDSFDNEGVLYVSSNHWFRTWYKAALENPDVTVVRDGSTDDYNAEAVLGDEHRRLSSEYKMGFVLRFLCGFAPSKFIRLTSKRQP